MSLSKPLKDFSHSEQNFEPPNDAMEQLALSPSREKRHLPGAVYKKNPNLVPERKLKPIIRNIDFKARSNKKHIVVFRYSKTPPNREPPPEMILSPDCVTIHTRGIPHKSERLSSSSPSPSPSPSSSSSSSACSISSSMEKFLNETSSIDALTSSLQMLNLQPPTKSPEAPASTVSTGNYNFPTKKAPPLLETKALPTPIATTETTTNGEPISLSSSSSPSTTSPKAPTKSSFSLWAETPSPKSLMDFSVKKKAEKSTKKPGKVNGKSKKSLKKTVEKKSEKKIVENFENCSSSKHCLICEDHFKRNGNEGLPSLFTLAPHCAYKEPGVTMFDSLEGATAPDDDEKYDNCEVVFGDFTNFDEFLTAEQRLVMPETVENCELKKQASGKASAAAAGAAEKPNLKAQKDAMKFFEEFIPKLPGNRQRDETYMDAYKEFMQPNNEPAAMTRKQPTFKHCCSKLMDPMAFSKAAESGLKMKKSMVTRKYRALDRAQREVESRYKTSEKQGGPTALERTIESLRLQLMKSYSNEQKKTEDSMNLPKCCPLLHGQSAAAAAAKVPKAPKTSFKASKKCKGLASKKVKKQTEASLEATLNEPSALEQAIVTLLSAIDKPKAAPPEAKKKCYEKQPPIKIKIPKPKPKKCKAKAKTECTFEKTEGKATAEPPLGSMPDADTTSESKDAFNFDLLNNFKVPNDAFRRRLQAQINFLRSLDLSYFQINTLNEIERELLKNQSKASKKSNENFYENYYFTKVKNDPSQRSIIDRFISGGWNSVKDELQGICGNRAQRTPMKMIEQFIIDCREKNDCEDIGPKNILPKKPKPLKEAKKKSDLAAAKEREKEIDEILKIKVLVSPPKNEKLLAKTKKYEFPSKKGLGAA